MKTITLNKYNATFRLHGNEETRSLQLESINVKVWPGTNGALTLTVIDEKDVPVYSKHLTTSESDGGSIPIHEKFVFYDHIAVHLATDPADSDFEAVISFE